MHPDEGSIASAEGTAGQHGSHGSWLILPQTQELCPPEPMGVGIRSGINPRPIRTRGALWLRPAMCLAPQVLLEAAWARSEGEHQRAYHLSS